MKARKNKELCHEDRKSMEKLRTLLERSFQGGLREVRRIDSLLCGAAIEKETSNENGLTKMSNQDYRD